MRNGDHRLLLRPAGTALAWPLLLALLLAPALGGCDHAVGREPRCGDGILDPGEACDGSDHGGQACTDVGFEGGTLGCRAGCDLDLRGCVGGYGNGVLEAGEPCDGSDLGPESCEDLGHEGGELACGPECYYDEARCFDCGDSACQAEDGETAVGCPGDCGWQLLSAGNSFTCGMRVNGTAWCWGNNDVLQLGSGIQGVNAHRLRT